MENRIKEAKDALRLDRSSCTSMHANQLRLLLTLAAFALFHLLRLHELPWFSRAKRSTFGPRFRSLKPSRTAASRFARQRETVDQTKPSRRTMAPFAP